MSISLCVIPLFSWSCHAADVLFLSALQGVERVIAEGMFLPVNVLSPSDWVQKDTSDFESYKAIITGVGRLRRRSGLWGFRP